MCWIKCKNWIKGKMNKEDTIKQISKMIASGELGYSFSFAIADDNRKPNGGMFCFTNPNGGNQSSYNKMYFDVCGNYNAQTGDVLAALRTAIDPIISEFRRSFKPFDYEGKHIEKVEDADVDHYDLKFRELASIWIEQKGGVAELINKVNATEDGSAITCFTDEMLTEDFQKFHNAHTHLRFLPKEINRKNQ